MLHLRSFKLVIQALAHLAYVDILLFNVYKHRELSVSESISKPACLGLQFNTTKRRYPKPPREISYKNRQLDYGFN